MIRDRLIKYLILLSVSVLIPFIFTVMIIWMTDDRIRGMKYFIVPSILIIHLSFALTQLHAKKMKRVFLGFLAAIIAIAIIAIPVFLDLRLNVDMYGYWDIIIFFAVGTIGAWELIYQVDRLFKKKLR